MTAGELIKLLKTKPKDMQLVLAVAGNILISVCPHNSEELETTDEYGNPQTLFLLSACTCGMEDDEVSIDIDISFN